MLVKYNKPNLFVLLGVKKLALLGMIELTDNVKENHETLKKLVEECQIETIPHDEMTFTGDQKVQNDFAGVGNHKSTYPCPLCKAKAPFNGEERAEMRTLGEQDEEHAGFVANGSKLKDAKEFTSTINKRLIHGPSEKKVIESFPPPTLHYMLRGTNYILKECSRRSVKKCRKRDHVKEFAIKKSIVRKGYHGGEFEVSSVNL